MDSELSEVPFDPTSVDLTTADPAQIICFLNGEGNEYDGRLGTRIAALFTILVVSTLCTLFPVIARRVPRLRIPVYIYLFARYFGAGVIVATAFIHLLQPAYEAIGPASCVGMTGGWAEYTWPPGIALFSIMVIFLVDVAAERWAEVKYGLGEQQHAEGVKGKEAGGELQGEDFGKATGSGVTSMAGFSRQPAEEETKYAAEGYYSDDDTLSTRQEFHSQFAGFLVLEFGVIFHSIIIGLNLGVAGEELNTLFIVLVFHQGFEGLGIGARMSALPFKKGSYLPWILCLAYGLSTPIAIAIGIGLRTTYNPGSFTANVVSGVLDSLSAGILTYTGLVELLARDFLFDPKRTRDNKKLTFMLACTVLGAGLMALLGKWA
ncbi:hypothetical protein ABW19_dt0201341 [Dactylella cylindrospora]|nr:hypothetical protein ABW19_dt0201341 [Dactylella cylindrospora]